MEKHKKNHTKTINLEYQLLLGIMNLKNFYLYKNI